MKCLDDVNNKNWKTVLFKNIKKKWYSPWRGRMQWRGEHLYLKYETIMQYNTILYNTIKYYTIMYNTIQYNAIQYNTIQYNTI